ncbi:MAG: hypothetical protein HamCj_21420 [Candidatus Hamiltonella defensa (Ceratovacuna japonica)]
MFVFVCVFRHKYLDDFLSEVLGERILMREHAERSQVLQVIYELAKNYPIKLLSVKKREYVEDNSRRLLSKT